MRQICILDWKHLLLAVGVFMALGAGSLALWPVLGPQTVIFTVAASTAILMVALLYTYRGLSQVLPNYFRRLYQQVDSRISIDRVIQPTRPLPPMGGVAVLPDFAVLVVDQILDQKPSTIVELGSGTSTVLCGYCLQKQGQGKIHSFDHLEQFADATRHRVSAHGLDQVATVTYAPLKPVTCDGQQYQWYDTQPLGKIESIDLLIIDGPPADLGYLARYPALPVFLKALSDRAVIILDDTSRPDEQEMIKRWLAKYSGFTAHNVPTEKGAVVLTRG